MNKSLIVVGMLVCMYVIFNLGFRSLNELSDLTDENKQAERIMDSTEEVKGVVKNKEDKSYMKREGSFLFIGGGETKVDNYLADIKMNDNITTIKLSEDQYINLNKGNKVDLVIDKENHEIEYDLTDIEDKKMYEKQKELNH
ncbi:hypothetical protein BUY32_11840 [Staphylococcus cohnii]|uniref:hypothetical protein n=1 Tax=Staphylococcus cohnii TaxID=29382 RepID=UPI000E683017|nr:hypothetical protein [Staphylococcus cohnii]RIL88134.1 hypothetical protein BUY32_11840 [Staphylococcus cohnii]